MSKKAFLAKTDKYYQKLGISKKAEIWEDGMRTTGREGTFEWWYCDSEYTDGTKVVVVFYTKFKFDLKSPANPTVMLDVTFPNGKTISKIISEGEGQKIRASKEQCDVKIGQSSINYSKGNYLIHFVDGDTEYTCTMRPKMQMWRPGTGHMYYGENQEDYLAWFVAQPSAELNATLKIEGKTLELNGNGYHDHNWGNIEMNKILNHWYWCRANIGPYTIIACDLIAEKPYDYTRLPLFMLAKDGIILDDNEEKTVVKRLDTEYHPITGKFIDNNLTFIQQTDDKITYQIEFIRHHDLLAVSMLNTPEEKAAGKALGLNPTYIRCIGKVKLIVDKEGKKECFEKEGLWEQMFFGNNKDANIEK